MNQLPNLLALARLWLASLDPAAPAAALILSVFAFVWLLRRFPRVWEKVEATVPFATKLDPGPVLTVVWKSWQALPGALFGAAVAALSSGVSVTAALAGVGAAAAASLTHEIMKVYSGAVAARKAPSGSSALAILAVFLALGASVTGCSLFSPSDYAHCVPSAPELLADVAQILRLPDYEQKLKELGLTKTEAAVICAVEQFVESAKGKAAASPDEADSVARGKAYLAKRAQ